MYVGVIGDNAFNSKSSETGQMAKSLMKHTFAKDGARKISLGVAKAILHGMSTIDTI